ncbi:4-hydroxybenzoyl-CoA thioesterase [Noviherbaspirillum humi]|uniref:4-hydroxybenzoyl-CoA thioesterase n=1 Tax=Noviherbaspirillum humi TaxID=1688639 RepID=A0A239K418_9BURK|nr:thioesterase family protein [Noviherbaspirillum humi]SNT12875.1 4-hydroxybenzoyl-CoA thioesterase [Noviherbaspirillum humi]
MTRKSIHRIHVEFGDCDPAQIAFYPNFFRWFDAASRHYFENCGVAPWREYEKTHGIIGTPVVETGARYHRPTSYGDDLEVHTWIEEWREKGFVMKHELRRDGQLLAEGRDVRVFATRHPADPARIRAVPVPQEIRALCDSDPG